MSTADKDEVIVCINCGKEGNIDNMNTCNKCKQVKYCNAACKKKHRSKHKKQCERRVAELHDKELFKQPPPKEDCPICFLRMPTHRAGVRYMSCCGKVVCSGCIYAPVYDNQGNEVDTEKCPFCRTPAPTTNEEVLKRETKRLEVNDVIAIHNRGVWYRYGRNGLQQNYVKALELYHRAGELGYARAYSNIGYAYHNGEGVEIDETKAAHYYELAAMGGHEISRHNLGIDEELAGNFDRSLKHYMISVEGGHVSSLEAIQDLYSKGYATKEGYTKALRSYQMYLSEIKSSQRDEAAAADEEYRYY